MISIGDLRSLWSSGGLWMPKGLDDVAAFLAGVGGTAERSDHVRWLFHYASLLASGGAIVEIGTYYGGSAIAMGAAFRKAAQAAGQPARPRIFTFDNETLEPGSSCKAAANIAHVGLTDFITAEVMSSAEALSRWRAEDRPAIDMLYVDGRHSYEDVFVDCGWMDVVAPGGIAVFDDWLQEVASAVRDYLSQRHSDAMWVPVTYSTHQSPGLLWKTAFLKVRVGEDMAKTIEELIAAEQVQGRGGSYGGWIADVDKRWLVEFLQHIVADGAFPNGLRIVEVGTYRGGGANLMLLAAGPKATIVCIDNWHDGIDPRSHGGFASMRDAFVHDTSTTGFWPAGRIELIEGDSREIGAAWAKRGDRAAIDLAYIDGAHDYDTQRADIEHFARWVVPGGWLLVDDYDQRDVVRAIRDAVCDPMAGNAEWRVERMPDNKPGAHAKLWAAQRRIS